MDIISNKKEIIYRNEFDNRVSYATRLSYKKQDGEYENGYINVVFNKDVNLENKTLIMIKKAWLTFYNTKDENNKITTHPYIRISDFEIVGYVNDKEGQKEQPKEEKKQDGWGSAKDIEIDPDELPFY